MKTKDPWGKLIFIISTDFSFFLHCKILNTSFFLDTSFFLESLMTNFFGLTINFKQWQDSIFAGATGGVTLIEDFQNAVFQGIILITNSDILRHLWQQYCSIVPHFLSTKRRYWARFLLMLVLIGRSVSSLWKFVFSSFSSSFIADEGNGLTFHNNLTVKRSLIIFIVSKGRDIVQYKDLNTKKKKTFHN